MKCAVVRNSDGHCNGRYMPSTFLHRSKATVLGAECTTVLTALGNAVAPLAPGRRAVGAGGRHDTNTECNYCTRNVLRCSVSTSAPADLRAPGLLMLTEGHTTFTLYNGTRVPTHTVVAPASASYYSHTTLLCIVTPHLPSRFRTLGCAPRSLPSASAAPPAPLSYDHIKHKQPTEYYHTRTFGTDYSTCHALF